MIASIHQTPAAVAPEFQLMVLASLSETLLLQMIQEKSRVQSLDWLQTMVDGGVLDVGPGLDDVANSMEFARLRNQWSGRAMAFTAFTQGIEFKQMQGEPEMRIAVFNASDDFKDLFRIAVEHAIRGYQSLMLHPVYGEASGGDPCVDNVMGKWMAAACVLDMPDMVRKIGRACPLAAVSESPFSSLSGAMQRAISIDEDWSEKVMLNPYFFALQLSHAACMDAVTASGILASPSIGTIYTENEDLPVHPTAMQNYVAPVCTPAALAHALAPLMQVRNTQAMGVLHAAGVEAMLPTTFNMRPYVQSYLAIGAYDIDPKASLIQAVAHGHPEVVDRVKGQIRWSQLCLGECPFTGDEITEHDFASESSPIFKAVENSPEGDIANHENAVLTLIDQAVLDGQTDLVLATFTGRAEYENPVIEPLNSMVEKGFSRVLVKYLDHGFDPSQRVAPNAPTFLQQTELISPEIAHLIRTHQARQKARDLMQGLNLSISPSAPTF